MNIPNLLTLFRIVAMIPIAIIIGQKIEPLYPLTLFILVLTYLSDAIDGTIARFLKQDSLFGARFDIVGDRIHEISLWLIFSAAGIFPPIMGIIFIIRGFMTDAIREEAALHYGQTPFGMIQNKIFKQLVSSRWSRALIGGLKLATFTLAIFCLLLIRSRYYETVHFYTLLIGWLTVIFNLVRGLPVLIEGKHLIKIAKSA